MTRCSCLLSEHLPLSCLFLPVRMTNSGTVVGTSKLRVSVRFIPWLPKSYVMNKQNKQHYEGRNSVNNLILESGG